MKKKLLLTFILHIHISLLFSQNAPNRIISGAYNNVSVHHILTDMSSVFHSNFTYCDECKRLIQATYLRIKFNSDDRKTALNKLAKYTPFTFQFINDTVLNVLCDAKKTYIKSYSLTGTVTNDIGERLSNTIIKIASIPIILKTDSLGNYKIENLPENKYKILYKKTDYFTKAVNLKLSGNTEQNYSLTVNNSLDFYPQGAVFETGYGSFTVRDEYISPERYTGDIKTLKLAWSQIHEGKRGYESTFDYVYGAKIRNYAVSAEVQEFSLNHVFLFPVKKEHYLFSKRYYSLIGPSAELWFHIRHQNISNYLITIPYSLVGMLSLGFNQKIIIPVNSKFGFSCFYKIGIFSLTGKTNYSNPDNEDKPSSVKLLTPLTGLRACIDYSAYYTVNSHITCKTGYEFRVANIANNTSWDDMANAMDIFSVKFIYNIR